MYKALKGFENILAIIIRICMWIDSLTVAIMVLLLVTDIICRNIFNISISGTVEVIEVLMVLVVFFALAYTTLEKGHVIIDLFTQMMSAKFKIFVNIFSSLCGVFAFALFTWQTGTRSWENITSNNSLATTMLHISLTPFMVVATIGSACICLFYLIQLVYAVSEGLPKKIMVKAH